MPQIKVYLPDGGTKVLSEAEFSAAQAGEWPTVPSGTVVNLVDTDTGEAFSIPFDQDSITQVAAETPNTRFQTLEEAAISTKKKRIREAPGFYARGLIRETASGATLGASTLLEGTANKALRATGAVDSTGPTSQEEMEVFREDNPKTALAASLLGAVAPLFLTGGASSATSGAQLAGRAATVLAGAGRAAQTVARALPTSMLSRAMLAGAKASQASRIGRLLGVPAASVLESSIQGGAASAEQAYIEGKTISEIGEDSLYGLGLGAVLGGVVPAGVGAVKGAARATGGIADVLLGAASRGKESLSGLERGTIRHIRENNLVDVADHFVERADAVSTRLEGAIEDTARVSHEMRDAILDAKFQPSLVPDTMNEAIDTAADALVSSANIAFNELNVHVLPRMAREFGVVLDDVSRRTDPAVFRALSSTEKLRVLDTYKRNLQKVLRKHPSAFTPLSAEGRAAVSPAIEEVQGLMQIERQIRDLLEDQAVVGTRFAQAQRQVNALWTDAIQAGGHRTSTPLMRQRGVPDATGFAHEVNRDAVHHVLFGNSRNAADDVRIIGARLEADRRTLDTAARLLGEDSPRLVELQERFARSHDIAVHAFDEANELRGARDLVTQARHRDSMSVSPQGLGFVAGTAAGSFAVGSAAMATASALQDPLKYYGYRDFVTRIARGGADRFDRAIGNSVETFSRSSKARVPVAKIGSYLMADGDRKSAKINDADYALISDKIQSMLANPDAVREQFALSVPDVYASDKELTASIIDGYTRALGVLQSLTSDMSTQDMAATISGQMRRVTPQKKRELETALSTMSDPKHFLGLLASGRLTSTSVDAMIAMYPGKYAKICEEVMKKVQGKQLTPSQRAQMAVLFRTPMSSLDEPESIQRLQQTYASKDKQAKLPKMPSKKMNSNSTQTATDRVEFRTK